MLDVNNLEVGKLYVVYTFADCWWVFKKTSNKWITGCTGAICLLDGYVDRDCTRICEDSDVVSVKSVNRNHIAMWNRTFNDNVEIV